MFDTTSREIDRLKAEYARAGSEHVRAKLDRLEAQQEEDSKDEERDDLTGRYVYVREGRVVRVEHINETLLCITGPRSGNAHMHMDRTLFEAALRAGRFRPRIRPTAA
jgi:antirestriction protein